MIHLGLLAIPSDRLVHPTRIALAAALVLGGSLAIARAGPTQGTAGRQRTTTVKGKVVGFAGPIEHALVGVKGGSLRVRTDGQGRFSLSVDQPPPSRLIAARPGYFISGVDWTAAGAPSIRLRACPQEDSTNYRWIDPRPDPSRPGRCGNCHLQVFNEWSSSPHAQSAVNPRFLNLVEGTDWHGNPGIGWSLRDEFPEGAAVCAACHIPTLEPGDPTSDDLRRVEGVHGQGIHCDFCHKITDVRTDNLGYEFGRFAVKLLRPQPGRQVFFGSLDDDDRGQSVYLPLYRQSRICAGCHEGILFGTHAYSEYSEWQASTYARKGVQCQDCHMAATGRCKTAADGILRDPDTLAGHGSARARADVLARHLTLSLEADRTGDAWKVRAEVHVRKVGHRMPTGFPSRALILCVSTADEDGRPLELLEGPVLPALAGEGEVADGNLAGQPGKIYAKVFESLDGQTPVPYWRVTRLKYDTRLMPDQIDHAQFLFRDPRAEFTVVARLIYRRFSKALADQKGWPDNEIVVATKRWRPSRSIVRGRSDSTLRRGLSRFPRGENGTVPLPNPTSAPIGQGNGP